MFKKTVLLGFLLFFSGLWAQEIETPYKKKKVTVSKDTIALEKVSINKAFFKILATNDSPIDTSFYEVDFQKGTLLFKNNFQSQDTLTVRYLTFPDYLTKTYSIYDDSKVVPNARGNGQLYSLSNDRINNFKPFDGLTTSGSITRGVTIGSNQNAVVNSNLDLQISGKLSDKVGLRASIQDSNIPLQEGGYSQKLDEFDQIFIELFSDKWNIRAGDLFLENRQSRFLNFNKKVQGISTQFHFGNEGNKTSVFASGALVRGQYAKSAFTGLEGNQGPYKLKGNNGESYVLVISGSERVFVNGLLLQRGENNQYTIDYNAGEVTFTSLFPITSEMRISIEYQFSDRNFTRFIAYGGVLHEREKWSIGGFLYSENDVKNQPLQQNLSTEQVEILKEAGDDQSKMVAPSAYLDSYSENKILYRKVLISGVEAYQFSTDPLEELYNVRFSLVGNNQGNYILANNQAVGRIYAYVESIAGVPQGNYEPIIRLIAPVKIQIATVMGKYNPSEKTMVDFELGLSNNDLNLYSGIDDANNQGVAGRFNGKQRLFTKQWTLDAFANYQFIQQEFRTIERLFTIEFDRDWNLTSTTGNQSLLVSGLHFNAPENGFAKYQFEKLDFSDSYSGSRHVFDARYSYKKWLFQNNSSFLKSDGTYSTTSFARSDSRVKYHWNKNWAGGSFRTEDNEEKIKATQSLSALSQRFSEFGGFIGRGDSTKVFVEVGYLHRVNDSLQNGFVQRVNRSHSYYLNSRLLQTAKSDLSVFVNYRNLQFEDETLDDSPSLNSRILYNDRFFNQLLQLTTVYETSSGTLAQQEFTYIEVDPGQGVYTWNDYNNNGIQELAEFEVAPFPDQAKYVRVYLPNQVFVNTHQIKFSQALTLNPLQWQNQTGFKKLLSYFYNQTSFLVDRKTDRASGEFNLNPFQQDETDLLGLNNSFMNNLSYNRGKQNHSVTYTFVKSKSQNLLSVGFQKTINQSHQLQYTHLLQKSWLFLVNAKTINSQSESENYLNRDFEILGYQFAPRVSYLFTKNASLDLFYDYQNKENQMGELETLQQNRFGTSFTYAGEKQFTLNGEVSFYANDYVGDELSAVGFQMLEGLQPGRNQTWRLLIQKNLTRFLDVNVNYQGRKSETSDTIHTGNVQLRAYF
jgi:hypothetical protein